MIYTNKTDILNSYASNTIIEVYKSEMVDILVKVVGSISRIDDMYDQRGLRVLMFFIEDDTGTIEVDYTVKTDDEIDLFKAFHIGDTVSVYGSVMDDLFREEYRIIARDIVKE